MSLPRSGPWSLPLPFFLLFFSLSLLAHAVPFASKDGDGTGKGKEKPKGAGFGNLETLRPLRLEDYAPELIVKRDANDFSRLDHQKVLNMQFGNPSSEEFLMMNMTLYTNEGESIIFLDQFIEDLESVDCDKDMTLVFNSKDSFEYAIKSWNWVNENETRKFILVTDHSKCAPKDQRQTYHIYDVDYDEEKHTAYLRGEKKEWEEVAQNVDLGSSVVRPKNELAKRFQKNLEPWSIKGEVDGPLLETETEMANVSFACIDCKWDITIAPSIVLNRRGGKLINFALELKTQGPATVDITTRAAVAGASGHVAYLHLWELHEFSVIDALKKVGKGKSKISSIAKFLSNFQIPGIFEWDVVVEFLFYAGLSKFSADGELTIGALTTLNEGAIISIDLLQAGAALAAGTLSGQAWLPLASLPFITDLIGWDPKVEPRNIDISKGQGGTVSAGTVVYLAVAIKSFGFKFEFGVYMKIPDVMVSFDTHNSPDTPCAKEGLRGTGFGFRFGFSLNLRFGTAGSADVIGISLTDTIFPIKFEIVPLVNRIREFFGGRRKRQRGLPAGPSSGGSQLARRDAPWLPGSVAPGLGPLFDVSDEVKKGVEEVRRLLKDPKMWDRLRKLSKKVSISGVVPIVGFYGSLPGWCAPSIPFAPSEHKPEQQPPPPAPAPPPPPPPPESKPEPNPEPPKLAPKPVPEQIPNPVPDLSLPKPGELPIPVAPSRLCKIIANDVNERSCPEAAPKCAIKFVHQNGGVAAFRCRSDFWTELDNHNFISRSLVDPECVKQLIPCEL